MWEGRADGTSKDCPFGLGVLLDAIAKARKMYLLLYVAREKPRIEGEGLIARLDLYTAVCGMWVFRAAIDAALALRNLGTGPSELVHAAVDGGACYRSVRHQAVGNHWKVEESHGREG